nr:unnamed protein product [Spirometra erinaceieuropaei]
MATYCPLRRLITSCLLISPKTNFRFGRGRRNTGDTEAHRATARPVARTSGSTPKEKEQVISNHALSHCRFRLPDGENLAPEIRNLLKEMKQELACLRKKLDFLSEEMVWVKTHIQDIEAKQADNRRALQAVSFVSKVKPPILQLPLRTAEAYKDFLTKIGSDNKLAQETVKHLSTVGGRTEKEFEPAVDENFRQHNDAV